MTEQHVVYAVAGLRKRKVRVSGPMAWDAAIDRWYQLDDARPHLVGAVADTPRVSIPKFGRVHYFAVRSADDPQWPARGKRRTPKVLI